MVRGWDLSWVARVWLCIVLMKLSCEERGNVLATATFPLAHRLEHCMILLPAVEPKQEIFRSKPSRTRLRLEMMKIKLTVRLIRVESVLLNRKQKKAAVSRSLVQTDQVKNIVLIITGEHILMPPHQIDA